MLTVSAVAFVYISPIFVDLGSEVSAAFVLDSLSKHVRPTNTAEREKRPKAKGCCIYCPL